VVIASPPPPPPPPYTLYDTCFGAPKASLRGLKVNAPGQKIDGRWNTQDFGTVNSGLKTTSPAWCGAMNEEGWPFILDTSEVNIAERDWILWPPNAVARGGSSPVSSRPGLGTCKANQWFAMTISPLDNGDDCNSDQAERDCYFCIESDRVDGVQHCPMVTRCHIYQHDRRGPLCRGIRINENERAGVRDKCELGQQVTSPMPPPPPALVSSTIASTGLVDRIMSIAHLGSLRVVTMYWDSTYERIYSLEYKFLISRTGGELEAILVRDNVGWSDRAAQRDGEAARMSPFIESIPSDHALRSTTRFRFTRSGDTLSIIQHETMPGSGSQYELNVVVEINGDNVHVHDQRRVFNANHQAQLFPNSMVKMQHFGDEAYAYVPSGAHIHALLKEATVITQPLTAQPAEHITGAGFVQVVDGTVGYGEGAFDTSIVGGGFPPVRPDLDLVHGEAFDMNLDGDRIVLSWQQDTYTMQPLHDETLTEWRQQLFDGDSVVGTLNVVGGLSDKVNSLFSYGNTYEHYQLPPEYDYYLVESNKDGFDYTRTLEIGTPIRSFARTTRLFNGETQHSWNTYPSPPAITRQVQLRRTLHWQRNVPDLNGNPVHRDIGAGWYDANRIAYLSAWRDASGGIHMSRLSSGPHACFDEVTGSGSALCGKME
jgi:hypothetical protein